MKVWLLHDTKFGNGKKLAEFLGNEFPKENEIKVGDVKKVSPLSVAEENPDVIVLGGAIRMFRGASAPKKWLKKLNKELERSKNKIQYGTAFLTHGLPTDKIQGFGKRFLKKMEKASMIEKTFPTILTTQVETTKGPILKEEMEKAKEYIYNFIDWIQK